MAAHTVSWTSWLPAAVAVLSAIAAIAAAVISAVIAGRARRKTAIAEFRQRWINEFRSDIADYLGAVKRHQELYDQGTSDDRAFAESDRQGQLHAVRAEAEPAYYRIRLRINPRPNPEKQKDDAFIEAIDALHTNSLRGRDEDWLQCSNAALNIAQELLKREWEVTKKG
ncbi:MAG: hypothetical protein OXU70_13550 [Gammaproteobacteria bacterium]|nr:hypothetical protein [Gammaproteobacteria bacterium]